MENFINFVGINFYILVNNNILEEKIPSQKELSEMKYLKELDCKFTNIEKIPQLNNLERLNCRKTKIKEIPQLNNLKILDCENTNIKRIPYLPNLKEIFPRYIKMRKYK